MTAPDALAQLHQRCFTMPRPWSSAEFAAFLASPFCFVQSHPKGFVLGRVIADEAELLTIAVAPEARRDGLGRQLLTAFDAQARARGAAQAFLEVAVDNQAARGLYLSSGWAEAGKRKGYYHTPEGQAVDAVVMVKPFSSPNI